MLDYAIVVATRNRRQMLSASLPTFVQQTRPAARIVVVDRSDDHEAVRTLCGEVAARGDVPIEVVHSDRANLPRQRNLGLERVQEAVTVFPDDDVLWFPDTAERLLQVYDADVNERLGAVSGIETDISPASRSAEAPLRTTRLTDRAFIARTRNRLESALVPQPFDLHGMARIADLSAAARADGLTYPLVPTIGGFRMSFRTALAQQLLFDEVLGSRAGYGQHEDKDFGLRVLNAGYLIAAAPEARVFHNVHPGKRAAGFAYGFFQILNYVYICRKVMPDTAATQAATRRYLSYKVALYSLRRTDDYVRDIHRGGRAALSEVPLVMATPVADLAARYAEICDRHLD